MTKYRRFNIWQLVHLGHELDEISAKLGMLATELNHGYADNKLLESTHRQIVRCELRLRKVLAKRRKYQNGH